MPLRHITEIADLEPAELKDITKKAILISDGKFKPDPLEVRKPGDNGAAALFQKASLRTKLSFDQAVHFMGGHSTYFGPDEVFTKGKSGAERETVEDIAASMEGMVRFIGARVFKNETIQRLVSGTTRAHVINLLCENHHPMQALADIATILKLYPNLEPKQIKVTYVGEWNNVATSLAQACATMGITFVHAGPVDDHLQSEEWRTAQRFAVDSGSTVTHAKNLLEGVQGAHIVYGDTFVSMGDEAKQAENLALYKDYQVTTPVMEQAQPGAFYLHCLPAYRGVEVHKDVLEGPQSRVKDLAEMRLHAQVAALAFLRDKE